MLKLILKLLFFFKCPCRKGCLPLICRGSLFLPGECRRVGLDILLDRLGIDLGFERCYCSGQRTCCNIQNIDDVHTFKKT